MRSQREVKTTVFPSTNVTSVSSMKNMVFTRARSTVHPNIVMPPGFICKYNTTIVTNKQYSNSILILIQNTWCFFNKKFKIMKTDLFKMYKRKLTEIDLLKIYRRKYPRSLISIQKTKSKFWRQLILMTMLKLCQYGNNILQSIWQSDYFVVYNPVSLMQ